MIISSMMHEFVGMLAESKPRLWKAAYPKRTQPPTGYHNPKYYAAGTAASAIFWEKEEMTMLPHLTLCVHSFMQMKLGMPTYFVAQDFCEAVANTNPPKDFKIEDINWPMDAMTFVLPEKFFMAHFGFAVPFISASRAEAGLYPDARVISWGLERFNPLSNEVTRMCTHFGLYGGEDLPTDYTGSYPTTMQVADIANAPFEDATEYEATLHKLSPEDMSKLQVKITPEEEKVLQIKVNDFLIRLILAMSAAPEYVESGSCTRPEKIKKGVVKEALWSPNMIGFRYRHERSEPRGGTHASPKMHWRRGHMHTVLHGAGRINKKLQWFKPVLVNA